MKSDINMKFKLKDKHFDIFVDEFKYWANKYSLNNWEFCFNFGTDCDTRAYIYRDHISRICLVFLNNEWEGTKPTERNIRHVAYHEAAEMLLSKINDLANSRSISKNEIEEAIHIVIRTLENTHWNLDMQLRNK